MREYAESNGEQAEIEAFGVDVLSEKIEQFDVVLLGPQIKFKLNEVKQIAAQHGKHADVINTVDYGTMNGEKVYKHAISLI